MSKATRQLIDGLMLSMTIGCMTWGVLTILEVVMRFAG
jgi:hypothetical protein